MRFRTVVAGVALSIPMPGANAQRPPVSLERVAEWGCMACTTGHQFSSIAALAVTPGGLTYVVDGEEPRVRIFDTTGAMVRAFGRRGRGPGELEVPVGIAVARDGSMQIPDLRNARLTRYSATGELTGTVPLTRMPTTIAHHAARDEIWIAFTDFRSGGEIERWLPADSSGTVVARLTDFPPAEVFAGTVHSMAATPAGGFVVGDGSQEYRIRRFGPDGGVVGADIVRDIAKVAKTEDEIAEHQAALERRGAQMRAALEGQSRGAGSAVQMPAVPPLRNHFDSFALRFDARGRLWVRTERAAPGRTIFDVFDPAGRFLGEIEVPVAVRAYDLAGEYLVSESETDEGVPRIVLWRVR